MTLDSFVAPHTFAHLKAKGLIGTFIAFNFGILCAWGSLAYMLCAALGSELGYHWAGLILGFYLLIGGSLLRMGWTLAAGGGLVSVMSSRLIGLYFGEPYGTASMIFVASLIFAAVLVPALRKKF